MSETLLTGALTLLAAVLGALITVINQNLQAKRQAEAMRLEEAASSKRAVIEDLVAYRFVLTPEGNYEAPTTKFNVALSKIPVLFGSNPKCIELYRAFGSDFTASKFHDLIVALMKDVPLENSNMDAALLENVPRRLPLRVN